MDSSGDWVALCEEWWERLSASPEGEMGGCVSAYLEFLGWTNWESFESSRDDATALVTIGDGASLAFYFPRPGVLDVPSNCVELGLDFCPATRRRVDEAQCLGFDYALITDLYRSYLYDTGAGELLLFSDAPVFFMREILPEVRKERVDDGSLAELRRPSRSVSARQLREWRQRWSRRIQQEPWGSAESAEDLMDRLIVLRFLADRELDREGVSPLNKQLGSLAEYARRSDARGAGEYLAKLFLLLHTARGMAIFESCPEVNAILACDSILAPMVSEFDLLSDSKFTIPTLLESFNFGDAAEKARVRLVPEEDEDREKDLAKQSLETVDDFQLTVDVLEEGYRAIEFWLHKIMTVYRRLNVEYRATRLADSADAGGGVTLAARVRRRTPRVLVDMQRHAVESGLRIYYASPRQYRTARLMLYLATIESYADCGKVFAHFPRVESVFVERPALLEAEKKWIYQRPADDVSRGWDVV